MEQLYQFPAFNSQWYNNSQKGTERTQKRSKRCTSATRASRALLIIDGAYFEQGTAAYMYTKFGIDLFSTATPDVLLQSFIETIEEELQVKCVHRYFITALFDQHSGDKKLRNTQNAMIETLEKE